MALHWERPRTSRGLRSRLSLSLAALSASAMACSAPDPGATKVEADPKRTLYGQAQKPPRAADPVLKSAELDTPSSRQGKALPDAEVDVILQRYAKERPTLADVQAASILRACANRAPASARCDGELGLLLLPIKKRKATALYYARAAAQTDDPKASADLYARLGEGLRPHGEYKLGAQAYAFAIAREDKVEFHLRRAALLSSIPGSNAERVAYAREAADELAHARATTPDDAPEAANKWDWLKDEAVLRSRVPDQWEQAVQLLKQVSSEAPNEKTATAFATRAGEVEALIKGRDAEGGSAKPSP